MAYDRGDSVRATATFTVASVNTDPTTIKLKIRNPAGLVTTYTYLVDVALVRSATGIYYLDFTLDSAGTWYTRWEGTGTCAAVDETTVTVQQGVFA